MDWPERKPPGFITGRHPKCRFCSILFLRWRLQHPVPFINPQRSQRNLVIQVSDQFRSKGLCCISATSSCWPEKIFRQHALGAAYDLHDLTMLRQAETACVPRVIGTKSKAVSARQSGAVAYAPFWKLGRLQINIPSRPHSDGWSEPLLRVSLPSHSLVSTFEVANYPDRHPSHSQHR